MKSASSALTVDQVSVFLAMYLLASSLFYSPINALLRYVIPSGVAAAFLEANLVAAVLFLLAVRIVSGQSYRTKLTVIDLAMFIWLAYGLIALVTTDAKSSSFLQSVAAIRNMFAAPVWYFFFRFAIRTSAGFSRVADFVYVLLKAATIYIFVEFLIVVVFDYRQEVEHFVMEARPDLVGLYYSVFSLWVRPAGPIFGQQNASILCVISLIAFYLLRREHGGAGYIWWILAAFVALGMTITITALLVLLLLYLGAHLKRIMSSAKGAGIVVFVCLILVLLYLYRAEILSIRVYGLGGDDILQLYEGLAREALDVFVSAFVQYPFGAGWDVPPDYNLSHDIVILPPEIFALRMSYYLGSVFFVFFVTFHAYLFMRYLSKRQAKGSDTAVIFAYGVVFALLLSTIHYESFTNTGFPQLYAFAIALLACYSGGAAVPGVIGLSPNGGTDSTENLRFSRNVEST